MLYLGGRNECISVFEVSLVCMQVSGQTEQYKLEPYPTPTPHHQKKKKKERKKSGERIRLEGGWLSGRALG